MFTGLMGNIKAIFIAIGVGALAILYFIFQNTRAKNRLLEAKVSAQKTQLNVASKVANQRVENEKLRTTIAEVKEESIKKKIKEIEEFEAKLKNPTTEETPSGEVKEPIDLSKLKDKKVTF